MEEFFRFFFPGVSGLGVLNPCSWSAFLNFGVDFPCPDLPFLAFWDFLVFFVARNVLAFLSVFPFFPRDFRDSEERKNPCFFGWFSLLFPKKQGKEDQGGLQMGAGRGSLY